MSDFFAEQMDEDVLMSEAQHEAEVRESLCADEEDDFEPFDNDGWEPED